MAEKITVERLRADGPFHVGDRYEVASDNSDQDHVAGTIIEVRPTGPRHVAVTVEVERSDS